jgi:nicotinamidase-related amidase
MACYNKHQITKIPILKHIRETVEAWHTALESSASPQPKSAVIVVDMQNDFIPMYSREKSQLYTEEDSKRFGWTEPQLLEANARIRSGSKRSAFALPEFGSYEDKKEDYVTNTKVIQSIERLLITRKHDMFVFSMDDHPGDSISFAKNREMWAGMLSDDDVLKHNAMDQFDRYPDHCVHGSWGQKILLDLRQFLPLVDKINEGSAHYILKGNISKHEGYSAFFKGKGVTGREAAPKKGSLEFDIYSSGLDQLLQNHAIKRLFICGTAQNICVCDTAIDAVNLGYETIVVNDCCKALEIQTEYIKTPADTIKYLEENKIAVKDLKDIDFNGNIEIRTRHDDSKPVMRAVPMSSHSKRYLNSVRIWNGY